MCVSVTDDILYIHGGYSKEKVSGQKKEGRIHEDMYVQFVQCSLIVRYSSVQFSTVQCSTVQCSRVQYSAVQFSAVQYSTV